MTDREFWAAIDAWHEAAHCLISWLETGTMPEVVINWVRQPDGSLRLTGGKTLADGSPVMIAAGMAAEIIVAGQRVSATGAESDTDCLSVLDAIRPGAVEQLTQEAQSILLAHRAEWESIAATIYDAILRELPE